ncbi:MAG: ribosome maturation factor RimM [Actinomycetota bacterium]
MGARLVVGRIVKPHGIRGEVVVEVETDNPSRYAEGSTLYDGERAFRIKGARPHQGRMLVLFEGVEDRNAAESLRNVELTIEDTEAEALPEGSYYPHQLQGCEVVDENGSAFGTLVRVDENPANDLWVVSTGKREVLVPAVSEFVRSVDLSARRIVLSPPDGLFG